jgi:cytochrome c-type biogenesis protein CcmF
VGVLLFFGVRSLYPLITFTLCIFVIAVLFSEFLNGTRARHSLSAEGYFSAFWNLVTRNKRRYGGYVIHFGIVLIFMGFGGNAFNMERQITLNKGESFSIKHSPSLTITIKWGYYPQKRACIKVRVNPRLRWPFTPP